MVGYGSNENCQFVKAELNTKLKWEDAVGSRNL